MVKNDGEKWLLELVQNTAAQLKQHDEEIRMLWEKAGKNADLHIGCREQVLDRLASLDKKLELTILKVGAIMAAVILLAEYVFNHLMGKL